MSALHVCVAPSRRALSVVRQTRLAREQQWRPLADKTATNGNGVHCTSHVIAQIQHGRHCSPRFVVQEVFSYHILVQYEGTPYFSIVGYIMLCRLTKPTLTMTLLQFCDETNDTER